MRVAAATFSFDLSGKSYGQTIIGNAGANVLYGGGGADTLIGLGGDDTYDINGLVQVRESACQGFDTILLRGDYVLGADVSVEVIRLSGSGNGNITGNAFAQTINGNATNNVIIGGGGGDTLAGAGGDDLYAVSDSRDVVPEFGGRGFDTVVTSVNYMLGGGASVEILSAQNRSSTIGLTLSGNELSQTIGGTAGADTLNGARGGDILLGFDGNDTYVIGDARGVVVERGGEGNDTVVTSISYVLGTGQEIETLAVRDRAGTAAIELGGNDFSNTLGAMPATTCSAAVQART